MTIRGVPVEKRWSPRATSTAQPDVRSACRAVVGVMSELRDGAVLGVKRRKHLSAAIAHVNQIMSGDRDQDLATPSCAIGNDARSRRSATSTTADVKRELNKILSEAIKPTPPSTTDDLCFDILRLRRIERKGWS